MKFNDMYVSKCYILSKNAAFPLVKVLNKMTAPRLFTGFFNQPTAI